MHKYILYRKIKLRNKDKEKQHFDLPTDLKLLYQKILNVSQFHEQLELNSHYTVIPYALAEV